MSPNQPRSDGAAVDISVEKHGEVDVDFRVMSEAPSCDETSKLLTYDKERKMETQRQAWFENAIKDKLKIPNSYEKDSVLMVRWHPDIDDYGDGHDQEIRKLKQVFLRFGFSVSPVVCLNTDDAKPQNILNLAIAQHIAQHDGANKLMIIYYTGHGLQMGRHGRLAFAATPDAHKVKRGKHHAIAYWHIAEELLFKESVEPDVLTILDCCFASRAHKGPSDSRRIYDLLAACDKDDTTPAPCPTSFTERLVATLEKFLDDPDDESILTTKLLEEINKDSDSPAYLYDRLQKKDSRHVQLKSLSDEITEKTKQLAIDFQNKAPEEAGIELRFSLQKRDLSKKKIEDWAQALIDACESIVPLRRIDWVKMEKNIPGQRLQRLVEIVHQKNPLRQIVHQKNPLRQRFRRAIEIVMEDNRTAAARRTNKRRNSEDPTPATAKRRASGNKLIPVPGSNPEPITPDSNAGS